MDSPKPSSVEKPEKLGVNAHDITMQQAIWIMLAMMFTIALAAYLIFRDQSISVENAMATLATVPAECRNEARKVMLEHIASDPDLENDDLQEAIEPVVRNCAVIGALTTQARE